MVFFGFRPQPFDKNVATIFFLLTLFVKEQRYFQIYLSYLPDWIRNQRVPILRDANYSNLQHDSSLIVPSASGYSYDMADPINVFEAIQLHGVSFD